MTEFEENKGNPGTVLEGQNRDTGKGRGQSGNHDLLLEYSEWLDGQGLVIGDGNPVMNRTSIPRKMPGEDMRSHSDLVAEFLNERDYIEHAHD